MQGWRFLVLETDSNSGQQTITAQGQVLQPIGNEHWLCQFFGEKSAYCKTLSAERLSALTLFPTQQMQNLFLQEMFPAGEAEAAPLELTAEQEAAAAEALEASPTTTEEARAALDTETDDEQLHTAEEPVGQVIVNKGELLDPDKVLATAPAPLAAVPTPVTE
jgi:hypothetical protein